MIILIYQILFNSNKQLTFEGSVTEALAIFRDNKLKQWRLLEPIIEDFNRLEDKKVGKWENHFHEYGFGVSLLKNKSFRSLVREGIPDKRRGELS